MSAGKIRQCTVELYESRERQNRETLLRVLRFLLFKFVTRAPRPHGCRHTYKIATLPYERHRASFL